MRTDLTIRQWMLRLFEREPWWAEFWSALTAVLWAGLTYASLETMREWPSMRLLVQIGDDRFWHLLGFGLGFGQLMFLASNRRWLRWGPRWRKAGSGAC